MTNFPKETKALFFSDIESSTRLVQELGEAYAQILERHRTIIRMALNRYSGREIDTSGDGFFVVFDQAELAVKAAATIQQQFASRGWARGIGLKVRIGIHYGEVLVTENGFTGLEVHRAARICNVGHGEQVLISDTIAQLVKTNLPAGILLKDLGSWQLKDFDEPNKLYQLLVPGTQQEFPLLRTGVSRPNVAVLPFTNLSNEPEQEYFCDGIAEEIILALHNTLGLSVVARSSSFALRDETIDAREIGRQLGATAILGGTVRKSENQLRISVELVDANSGTNIWSQRFDRQLKDVFALQDEITQNIIRALKIKLLPDRKPGTQDRQTDNIEAYDFYLKGRRFYYQFSRKGVKLALQMFQQAIELDDEYALAYCGLADCYSYLYMYDESSAENLREANLASLQAMELAPSLAEAFASRGLALTLKKQYKKAEAAFERAIELNPSLFEAWYQYGRASFAQGKLDRAARLFDQASRTRPEDYQSVLLAGQAFDQLGIISLAQNARQRGVAIVEKYLQLNPGDTRALYLGANGLVALGEREKGLEWLRRALTLEPGDCVIFLLKQGEKTGA